MVKRTVQALSLITIVALIALAAFSAVAGGEAEGSADEGSGSAILRHLHALGQKLHGKHGSGHHGSSHHGSSHHGSGQHGGEMGHHMAHIAQMVEELNLSEEQLAHFEKVHEIIGAEGGVGHGMAKLHEQLMGEAEDGYIETDAVRLIIDQHVEGMRAMAYGISDELIALINGLDAEQRETLMAHMEKAKEAP